MSEYRFPILPPGGRVSPPFELPFFKHHGHFLHMDAVKSTDASGFPMRQDVVTTNDFDVLTWTAGGGYYVNLTVGTPPQYQTVLIDTGSSDLYFHASNAAASETSGPFLCKGGTFSQYDSITYNLIEESPAFGVSFADGSSVTGSFGNDTIGLGNVALPNVQFGVAETISSTTGSAIGVMGLGYPLNEAMPSPYPNIPAALVDAGVTNSRLYSIFLNSEDKVSGTILFGGIDTTKYTGDLVTLDLLPDKDTGIVDKFATTVTAATAMINGRTTTFFNSEIAETCTNRSQNASFPVLLDTGSAAWTIPQDLYTKHIAPAFPFVDDKGHCSCSHRDTNNSVSLELDHRATITVPAHELMIPLYDITTRRPIPYNDGSDACQFLIIGTDPSPGILHSLGDAILRSMYVVYDLDNEQVSVAQAAVNTTTTAGAADVPSNIIPVCACPSGVAQAVQSTATKAPNRGTIAPPEQDGSRWAPPTTFSTLASVIGTATGNAAVPTDAQAVASADARPGLHNFSLPGKRMMTTTTDLTIRQSRERREVSNPQISSPHDDIIFTAWISTALITAVTFLLYKLPGPVGAASAVATEGVEAAEGSNAGKAIGKELGIGGRLLQKLSSKLAKWLKVPENKPVAESVREPVQGSAEESAERPAGIPAERPAERPAEEPAERPAERPVERPAERPVEGPAEGPAEESAEELASGQRTPDSWVYFPDSPPVRPGGSLHLRPGSPPFPFDPPWFPHSTPRFPPGVPRFPRPPRFPPGLSRFPSQFGGEPATPPSFPPAPPPGTDPLARSRTYVAYWYVWRGRAPL